MLVSCSFSHITMGVKVSELKGIIVDHPHVSTKTREFMIHRKANNKLKSSNETHYKPNDRFSQAKYRKINIKRR